MKALHLLKTSVGAGWALRQIRELVKTGVDVHVALPGGGPMVGKYAEAGATEYLLQTDFPIRSPWRFPAVSAALRQLVKTIRPDIIHSHFVGTTLTMRLSLGSGKTMPRIFQVPGPLHLEHPFFRYGELLTAGESDYWIGSCRWTCDRYEQAGIEGKRIFLSYYGTDVDSLTPRTPGKLRDQLGFGTDSQIVGMVAYMYAPKRYLGQKRGLKGHEDLIDAMKLCLQEDARLRCVIAGGAWNHASAYEAMVRNYAHRQCGNKVIFLGERQDIPEIYADFDVAVHPSLSENVGGAVESCLLGVPTIVTRTGGFPDLVHDGITGWLVPPKNPQLLARAILDALGDRRNAQKKAIAGQKLARSLFDVHKTAAEIKMIYEKILDRTG